MNIKNNKQALEVFVESAYLHGIADETGNYKSCNKNYDKIIQATNFLKKNHSLKLLEEFLDSEYFQVKLWAASYLLTVNEEKGITTLKNIIQSNIPHYSFSANMILNEWKNGDLKL